MSQTKVQNTMKNKFNIFTKLSVGFGVSLVFVVAIWFTLLALELTDTYSVIYHKELAYIYYAVFFLSSILVPAWVAMAAGSAINSLSVTQINTRKYKIELLVAGIISILGMAGGAFTIVMGFVQAADVSETNWTLIGIGTMILLLALIAIIFGVICNIISLNKSKKK